MKKNDSKQTSNIKYPLKVNAMVSYELKEALVKYAKDQDLTESIVVRRILTNQMRQEGLLKQ